MLSVAELMPDRIDSPLIISLALHASRNRTMSLLVLSLEVGFLLERPTCWVQQVLCIDLLTRWNAKFKSVGARSSWPIVTSLIPFAKRLANRGGIVALTYVIEFVCEAIEVLSFDDLTDRVSIGSALAKAVLVVDLRYIVVQSEVDLANAWGTLHRLTILFEMLRR